MWSGSCCKPGGDAQQGHPQSQALTRNTPITQATGRKTNGLSESAHTALLEQLAPVSSSVAFGTYPKPLNPEQYGTRAVRRGTLLSVRRRRRLPTSQSRGRRRQSMGA